jgi:hypothetical protein
MTLQEAISAFTLRTGRDHSSAEPVALLNDYLRASGLESINQIAAPTLRDFLARWYVEIASAAASGRNIPSAQTLLASLEEFFKWADEKSGERFARECLLVLSELKESLPRSLEITGALSKHVAERGGAFGFPEFLTSFEEGGHSEYDIGEPGEAGAIEGYFLIERVDHTRIQAVEIISEKRVWPVIFPEEVARLLSTGFIINLEIVRRDGAWQVTACGFAYPPKTEITF